MPTSIRFRQARVSSALFIMKFKAFVYYVNAMAAHIFWLLPVKFFVKGFSFTVNGGILIIRFWDAVLV